MARRDDAPRDLLFGLLALQNGLVTRDQLAAAVAAWAGAPGRVLADLLVGQGAVDADGRDLLLALADRHLRAHGGDPEKSLAALDVNASTREDLAAAGGPDVAATLAHAGSGSGSGSVTSVGPDPDDTRSYAVGTATADGRRFRVLRPHARGGLGAVFVALDTELNREVALKEILDQHADDPVSRQRFLLEAEITGGLEHPGIVPVYGLGSYDGGRPYYAMRFVRGDSLREAIERFHADAAVKADPGRRSLELRMLLRRFLDVCDAIDYAHSRGVLHRDIKPGNVIVGKHGETLVVDWGLAKPVGRPDPASSSGERTLVPASAGAGTETLPGSALGTPAYMSPEQAAGDIDRLGVASDVYGLGATLYCVLTGRAPFAGDDAGTVLRAVRRGEFPPPRRVEPGLDPALEAVCLKAMALAPASRYASARALADEVEHWLADEPVSAYREGPVRRLARHARRHRTLVAGGAVAALALVAALAGGLVITESARRVTDRVRRRADAARADALRTAIDGFHLTAGSSLATARMLRTAPGQPDPRAQALAALATAGGAERRSAEALASLGAAAGELAREEPARWRAQTDALRDEAVWWLTRLDLLRLWELNTAGRCVAVDDASRRVAVVGPDALEVYDDRGRAVRRVAAPDPQTAALVTYTLDAGPLRIAPGTPVPPPRLTFPAPDRVELRGWAPRGYLAQFRLLPPPAPGAAEVPPFVAVVVRWSLADGRVTHEVTTTPAVAPAPPPGAREVAGSAYVAAVRPDRVEVRARAGGEPLVVWEGVRPSDGSFAPYETCREALFAGPGGRALVLVIDQRSSPTTLGEPNAQKVVLVDPATGARHEAGPGSEPRAGRIDEAVPFADGFLTIERPPVPSPFMPPAATQADRRVAFWSAVVPAVRVESLGPDRQARGAGPGGPRSAVFSETADGRLAAAWGRGSLGRNEVRFWDGAGAGARPAWSDPGTGWNYQGAAAGFSARGDRLIVARPDGSEWALEVFDARTGALARSWPMARPFSAAGSVPWRDGQVVRVSDDGAYAVVAATGAGTGTGTDRASASLELWSLTDLRPLGPLGTCPSPDGARTTCTVEFSQGSRRLFVLGDRAGERRATFWKLDPLTRTGTTALQGHDVGLGIETDEQGYVRIGSEVFGLDTAARRCTLETPALNPGVRGDRPPEVKVAASSGRWLVGFYPPGGLHSDQHQCVVWDTNTGKHARLGDPVWSRDAVGRRACVLRGDRLLVSGPVGPFGADPVVRTEMWDLGKASLVRRADEPQPGTGVEPVPSPWDDGTGAVVRAAGRMTGFRRWAWADGRVDDVPDLGPVLQAETLALSTFRPSVPTRVRGPVPAEPDRAGRPRWLVYPAGGSVRLRSLADAREVVLEDAPPAGLLMARVDPRGRVVVLTSGGNGRAVPPGRAGGGVWDAVTGRRLVTLDDGHAVYGLDPGGGRVVGMDLATSEVVITALDARAGARRARPFVGRSGSSSGPLIGLDGDRLAFVARGALHLWDAAADRPVVVHRGTAHSGWVTGVAQHAGAGLVATGDADGTVVVRDRGAGRFVRLLDGQPGGVSALAFSPDGARLATASPPPPRDPAGLGPSTPPAPAVVLWDLAAATPLWTHRADQGGAGVLALDWDRAEPSTLLVVTTDGRVTRLDAATGRARDTTRVDATGLRSYARSPDGTRLLLLTPSGRVLVRDAATLAPLHAWDAATDDQAVAGLPGPVVVTAGRAVCLRDAATGRALLTLDAAAPPVRRLAFAAGTGHLIYTGDDDLVRRVDLTDLQRRLRDLHLAAPLPGF